MADVERHARLLVPAGVLAFEEMAEEALLQRVAVIAVEMREVGVAMHFQPFLLGAGAQIAFEIAARMQSHAAPIAGREQRRLDLRKIGGARGVIIVDKLAALGFAGRVGAASWRVRHSGSVSGPATNSPVTTLLAPRLPTPCCTLPTWRGCQLLKKSLRMPPCRHSSR